jgi:hypothetical protein
MNYLNFSLIGTLLFLLTAASPAIGQNVRTTDLIWTVDRVTDLKTGAANDYQAAFYVYNTSHIDWLQRNGQMSTRYEIKNAIGKWDNVQRKGSIAYQLERSGHNLKMTMEKNSSGIFITLDLGTAGDSLWVQKFHVVSVQTIAP